jgi:hypothetical protein
VLPADKEAVSVHTAVSVAVVRMLPEGVPPVAVVVEDPLLEVLAEPVALRLSTLLMVASDVREPAEDALKEGEAEGVNVTEPVAEAVSQGEDVAERDHVLVNEVSADKDGGAVADPERVAAELLVGTGEKEIVLVPVSELVAEDVEHTDTVDVGDREADSVKNADDDAVPEKASTDGDGETPVVGDFE